MNSLANLQIRKTQANKDIDTHAETVAINKETLLIYVKLIDGEFTDNTNNENATCENEDNTIFFDK